MTLAAQVLTVHLIECVVTSTRNPFQTSAIQHPDDPTPVVDEIALLNEARGFSHARTTNPKHLGKELVGNSKRIGTGAIVRHEQPARDPSFQLVKSSAGGGLRDLRHQHAQVCVHDAAEAGIHFGRASKMRAAHSHRQAFTLDQVVLLIALLAMARKFIILDLGQVSTGQLLGLATITLVLGVTYGLMRERDDRVTNIAKERST